MKKLILILLLVFLTINFVFSQSQTVVLDYNYNNITRFEKSINYPDFLLKVITENNSICKYSVNRDINYIDMEGSFETNTEKIHEKSFVSLSEGVTRYFIKCIFLYNNSFEPSQNELLLRVNSYVTGKITLSRESPLKSGQVEVSLTTSKIISQTPILSYSFDGITYNDLPLVGSQKNWKGYLMIPKNAGETLLSFKFSASDLEGRQGQEITSGKVFVIDTIKPKMVSYIDAESEEGRIKLEWYYDEDFKEFRIFRSNSPNSDYTNFYKIIDGTSFYDTLVDKGKTYYYRVSPVDEAGNEGELSKEVLATALLPNNLQTNLNGAIGLNPELLGFVDNFIVEIDSVISDLESIKENVLTKPEKDKSLFNELQLDKDLETSKLELSNLRKDIERFKSQDLKLDELNKKIDSSRLKLNVIKRKIPESFAVINENEEENTFDEKETNEILLELYPTFSQKEIERSLKATKDIIKESGYQVKSYYYILNIIYLDGTKKEISLIKRDITSQLTRKDNYTFIEYIPKDVAESTSEIQIKTLGYGIVKEDPIISFGTDTKQIIYIINKKSNLDLIKNTKFYLINIPINSEESNLGFDITGYFLLDYDKKSYFGIVIATLFLSSLIIYFFYLKYKGKNNNLDEVYKKLDLLDYLLELKDEYKAEISYRDINNDYIKLSSKEKEKLYPKIEKLRERILILKLKKGIIELNKNKDFEKFKNLEKIFNSLSIESRKEISPYFYKLKKNFENI
ncbi:MAG: hypothetical protein WC867_07160 [Candidatus Pacearchaeota archaeon]|jgi:hypothetical protein